MALMATDKLEKVNLDNIPKELQEYPRWLVWKAEPDRKDSSKLNKVPKNLQGKALGSWQEVSNLFTFEDVKNAYDSGNFAGIGFSPKGTPFQIVDLDNNSGIEHISKELKSLSDAGYAEISPSNKGLHVFMQGNVPDMLGRKKTTETGEQIEFFSNSGWVTVTGNRYNDKNPEPNQQAIDHIIKKYGFEKKEKAIQLQQTQSEPTNLAEHEIMQIMSNSKSGSRIAALMRGDTSEHNDDPSSSDMALANHLAFWTQKDANMMDSIFRNSGLYRDKWDKVHSANGQTYGQMTIEQAISNTTNVYSPRKPNFEVHIGGTSKAKKAEQKKKKETDKTPKTPGELQDMLIDAGKAARKSKEYTVGKGDNAETKYPRLTSLEVAYILNDYFFFYLFDLEEGTRLAVYMRFDGIYTQNETVIKRYISYLEPTFTERQAEDVIYKIANLVLIKEKTNSRYLIPVNNGVFNLETKQLEPFTPDYIFTSKIATDYNDKATLPIYNGWDVEQWLKDLANGEDDLNTLLWQVISASMNGNFTRKQSIWLYGQGRSGKGTYQDLISNLVGSKNVATLKVNQFSERFALPMLEEKVVCIGDDVPAHVYIDDSSNFNSVVTGDSVRVERKNKDGYSTNFKMTVIQSTNGLPRIHNKTEGTYRRFLIVQFKEAFTNYNDNWSIKNDYIKRKDVLEYVLQKAIKLDFEKFITPESSKQLMENYKIENDPIRDFKVSIFDEFTSTRIPVYLLYQYYLDFCDENKYKYMSSRNFINSFEKILDEDWEKKKAKIGNFFNETYLPIQLDKNRNIESPSKEKPYTCFVNTRIEIAS